MDFKSLAKFGAKVRLKRDTFDSLAATLALICFLGAMYVLFGL